MRAVRASAALLVPVMTRARMCRRVHRARSDRSTGAIARVVAATFAGSLLCLLWPTGTLGAVVLPDGFFAEPVLRVRAPTAIAFTPGDSLLVATKSGRLLLLRPGTKRPLTVLDLGHRICDQAERGLVGLAVDPDFRTNRFVYAFFTRRGSGCGHLAVSRVSRYVLRRDGRIDPTGERVLLDNIMSPRRHHVGGDLQFGKDGYLYISVGDGSCHYRTRRCGPLNSAAREEHVLLGKVLRVDRDGRAPPGNGTGTRCALTGRTRPGARCREIFATGLRNPFRMAFDPNAQDTRFFINDVGEQTWEEINLGRLHSDYGWNLREGRCPVGSVMGCGPAPPRLTDPLFTYWQPGYTRRGERGCEAITGGAFVPDGAWPEAFADDYLFADYVCGKIFRLEHEAGTYRAHDFASDLGPSSAVHLLFGPGPSGTMLYFTTLRPDGGGVWRIGYAPGNRRPVASASVDPRFGPAPLDVHFDAAKTTDPDGDDLVFSWDFGDGSSVETREPRVAHTYRLAGVYRAKLLVRDTLGARSDAHHIRVDVGNTPPRIRISGPHGYDLGETIVLRARAIDAEDGTVGRRRVTWNVVLHHEEHTHPYRGPLHGARIAFRAPVPGTLHDARTTHLRVHVRASDTTGLIGRAQRPLRPRNVTHLLGHGPRAAGSGSPTSAW